jgi:putative hydrolase of the HAD superfamily
MGIRAVVWDIDDTLYDYTGSDRAAALRHFAEEGLLDGPAQGDAAEAALARWDAVMTDTYQRFLDGELTFVAQRRERARAFLGRPLGDAEADAWFGRYLDHRDRADALFPDVLPALDALAGGYRHGLLSNSSHLVQERRLRALGVRDRFEVLLCTDRLGCAKPAPEAFHAACEALGLPPEAVAYVGDQPETDAAAAHAAGLHGIWLDRAGHGGGVAYADGGPHRIDGLAALPELLLSPARRRPGPPARSAS